MAVRPLDLWNHWSIQILVLVSLACQVALFLLAGTRRRQDLWAFRPLLWFAYQLADTTAIYALGHLSVSSVPRSHQLVTFWAPLLLLHLGGPDSITAYSLEDSKLWKRHMLTVVLQVLGAAYVLYKQIAGNEFFVRLAAYLMFTVGVVKYGERTWALKCCGLDSIESSLKKQPLANHHQFHARDHGFGEGAAEKEELYVRRAHSLFHICKRAIVDSWIEKDSENHGAEMLSVIGEEDYEGMWTLMELELSLMYDILYTKAAVIHTWSGYSTRVASSLATAASFLLFHFSAKHGNSRVDVAVTYTLLGGAILLETISFLSALGSSWTYTFLCTTQWRWIRYAALCTGRWDRLRRLVKTMTARRTGVWARRWSGEMGQYNMLHLSTRPNIAFSRPVLGRLAKVMGLQQRWDTRYYTGTIEVSEELKEQLFLYTKLLATKNKVNTQGVVRKRWGHEPLKKMGWYDDFGETYLGAELQEGIIFWHIGTDVFLARSSRAKGGDAVEMVKAITALSNYMMFLLVDRPDMLPGLAHNRLYKRTCENLDALWRKSDGSRSRPNRNVSTVLKELFCLRDDPNTSRQTQREDLANILYRKNPATSVDVPRLHYAHKVAEILLEKEKQNVNIDVLEVIRDVWMDFLVYTANRCSRESHAKRLSRGGELTTVVWLMADYFHQNFLNSLDPGNV